MKTDNHIYLYLAARNKKGVKVLTVISGSNVPPSRLTDIQKLMLPYEWESKLKDLIHENRMHWEPWIESAATFQDLRLSLRKRGYVDLPIHSTPLLDQTSLYSPPVVNTKSIPRPKLMIQRGQSS